MHEDGRHVPFLDTRSSMHYKNSGSNKTEKKADHLNERSVWEKTAFKHTKNMKQKLAYGQQNIKQDLKCVVGKQLEPYELETYIYCKSRTPLPLLHGFKTVAQGKSSSC